MPANLHRPNPPDSEERFHPAPLGYEGLECGSKVFVWHREGLATCAVGVSPTRELSHAVPAGVGWSREQAVSKLGSGPSGRGRLWRSGPPRQGLDRPAWHGRAELDPIDDRDRVESLSPLPRYVAVVIP
jgi:hypothetical protein